MKRTVSLSAALVLVSCAFGRGSVEWSGIEPHPAVVSPVCAPADGSVIDLAGEWEFCTLRHGADRSQFFRRIQLKKEWPDARKIRVPGTWEDQGVGGAAQLPARVCYGGVRHDFPLRHSFVGNGWYRRTAEIPRAWVGKRIWLKVGGVASQGLTALSTCRGVRSRRRSGPWPQRRERLFVGMRATETAPTGSSGTKGIE